MAKMGSPRQTSSVYSDSFELDELLENLSDQVWKQDSHVVLSLAKEKGDMESELAALREIRECVHAVIVQMNGKIAQLHVALNDAKRSIQRERVNWVSNCTAF
jgi:hypothetical protein